MKKILYSILALLALSTGFVSCSDDDDENSSLKASQTPEIAAAGTYTGTWTIEGDYETVTTSGTITVAPTDSAYCADITFVANDVAIQLSSSSTSTISLSTTSVANITYAGSTSKFAYSNYSTSNGLGVAFVGRIDDGTATSNFTLTQKVGRTTYTFVYSFEGTK